MSGWNPQTWQALIDRYSASLVMFAAQWVADPEDVVQEAYFELFRTPTPPDAPPAWLFAVVRNKALTAIRSDSRRRNHEQRRAAVADGWFEESYADRVDAGEVGRWLDEIPADLREIVIARVWGELTFEQIAAMTGQPRSTCHRRYREALDVLRKRSGEPCPNSNP